MAQGVGAPARVGGVSGTGPQTGTGTRGRRAREGEGDWEARVRRLSSVIIGGQELSDPPRPSLPEYGNERHEERFWEEVRPRLEPVRRRWFLPVVVLLLVLNVPWYWPDGLGGRMIGGLPVWAWAALLTSVLLSLVTAFVALRAWRDDD